MKSCKLALLSLTIVFFFSCSKSSDKKENSSIIDPEKISIKVYEGLAFSTLKYGDNNPYFSTIDTANFKVPVAEAFATANASKIDLMYYYYTAGAGEPGFIDPYTASQHWYWDDYYTPWLSATTVRTKFYLTELVKSDFDAAKKDLKKLDEFFKDSRYVRIAPHSIFPEGTCLGGRQVGLTTNITLKKGGVYGFISNEKKGLIYIHTTQPNGWPAAIESTRTYVDILKEQ